MERIEVNKKFDSYEEMEKYTDELNKKYIIFMIAHMSIGSAEYGIDYVLHCGERGVE